MPFSDQVCVESRLHTKYRLGEFNWDRFSIYLFLLYASLAYILVTDKNIIPSVFELFFISFIFPLPTL
jgi:hypothetical protein